MLPVFDDAVAMHVVLPRETVARVLAAALRAAEGELADADAADAGAAARRVAARRAVLLTLGWLVSHVSPSATSSDPSKGQHQARSGQRTRWMGPRAPCHCSSPPSERVSIAPPAPPQGAGALQAGRADR